MLKEFVPPPLVPPRWGRAWTLHKKDVNKRRLRPDSPPPPPPPPRKQFTILSPHLSPKVGTHTRPHDAMILLRLFLKAWRVWGTSGNRSAPAASSHLACFFLKMTHPRECLLPRRWDSKGIGRFRKVKNVFFFFGPCFWCFKSKD